VLASHLRDHQRCVARVHLADGGGLLGLGLARVGPRSSGAGRQLADGGVVPPDPSLSRTAGSSPTSELLMSPGDPDEGVLECRRQLGHLDHGHDRSATAPTACAVPPSGGEVLVVVLGDPTAWTDAEVSGVVGGFEVAARDPQAAVEREGIRVHEMLFPDGDGPPGAIVDRWLALVEARREHEEAEGNTAIAVHCVAGLGRAPVLVAISLIEAGMSPLDAVSFLRERRRGAINNKQLRFLESYRRKDKGLKCLLM